MLGDHRCVRLQHLPHLRVVLGLDDSDEGLLRVLVLVLVQGSSLLELLQGDLKLLLRLYQILLVCLLLLFKELTLALP